MPHLAQKVLPGPAGVPQLGQVIGSGVPHALQYFCPGALLAPHLGHLIHCCISSLRYIHNYLQWKRISDSLCLTIFLIIYTGIK